MIYRILGLTLLLIVSNTDADAVPVVVTKKSALESISAFGTVTDINEAVEGQKFLFVKFDGAYLILKDVRGHYYRIAQSATDFNGSNPQSIPDFLGGPNSEEEIHDISQQGEANLQALVTDHPELLTIFKKGDDIWKWLAVRFSNNDHTVIWSNKTTDFGNYIAFHTYSKMNGYPILFLARRKKDGSVIPPEFQLSGLVFELLNITHEGEFMDTANMASKRELSQDQFAVSMAKIEFKTCSETKRFFFSVWLPYAIKNKRPLGGNWHASVGDNFEDWLYYHRFIVKDGYPDQVYDSYYQSLMGNR